MSTTHDVIDPQSDLSVLWEPVTIGPVTIRNRVSINPLNTHYGEDNVLSDRHLAYYAERARGGVGLIISEQHIADRESITLFQTASTALDPRAVPAFAKVAEAVHELDTRMFVQLYAAGPQDSPSLGVDHWHPLSAPSPIPSLAGGDTPKVMDKAEIREITRNYGRAARNVEAGGMDGVEFHAAHGWLFHRFMSPLWNQRTDEYGGSVENRVRLLLEAGESVREATSNIALGAQLSVDDYMGKSGLTYDDTDEFIAAIADSGLFDYVNLSTGNEFSDQMTMPTMEVRHIPSASYAPRARKIIGDRMKIVLGGGVETIERAARLVQDGHADMVSLSRPHLADPHIVNKAKEGRTREITPCIGSNECFRRNVELQPLTCQLNPLTGRERIWGSDVAQPKRQAKRVVIVGGGPAGLQAALAASGAGHDVVLFEREQSLGGHLSLLAALPHRERWGDAISWFEYSARQAGVDIRLGVEVTPETPELAQADIVLCATGATWQRSGYNVARPDVFTVPGVEQENVIDITTAIRRALEDGKALGESVVIVDETGQYLPLGLADLLSPAGVRVEITTRLSLVGHDVVIAYDHREVFERLAERDVAFRTGHVVTAVEGNRVSLVEGWSGHEATIDGVDTVVLCMLRDPDTALHDAIGDSAGDARLIGDALMPRRTGEVIHEGQVVGSTI